jgi:hypothetical protein
MAGPGGRPSKLTRELIAKLARAVARGNYVEVACAEVGIAKSTFYEWLQLGQAAPSGPHREFSDAIKKAQASAEARDLAVIDAAAQAGVWQAAAWKLERRSPERWSLRVRGAVLEELNSALDRLKRAFASEPRLYERVLVAMAGAPEELAPSLNRAGSAS